jgi:hypothetical protein
MPIRYGTIPPVKVSHLKNNQADEAFWNAANLFNEYELNETHQAIKLVCTGKYAALLLERYYKFLHQKDMVLLGMHQVAHILDKYYKFPCRLTKIERTFIETWGLYWYRLLKLCERLHSYQTKEYENAAEWFYWIVREWVDSHIPYIFAEFAETPEGQRYSQIKKGGRQLMSDIIKADHQRLRGGEFSRIADVPHRNQLFTIAIHNLGSVKSELRKDYWYPLLDSYAKLGEQFRTNGSLVSVVEVKGRNYYLLGSGTNNKGRIPLSSFYIK